MSAKPIHGTPAERFVPKVDIRGEDECWLWTAYVNPARGYGSFNAGNHHTIEPHRFAYELWVGPIPEGLHLDHLCRNPLCCNPKHLEPVTPRENLMRGQNPKIISHHTGICMRGHSLADARRRTDGRVINCRTCRLEKRRSGEWT